MLDHPVEDTFDAKTRSNLNKYPLATLEAIAKMYRDIVALDPCGPVSEGDREYLADVEAAIAAKWGGWEWCAQRGA